MRSIDYILFSRRFCDQDVYINSNLCLGCEYRCILIDLNIQNHLLKAGWLI